MTLRGRLTAAFLAMVLGPVLLGVFVVGATLTAVSRQTSQERLDLAVSAVRTSVQELCARLRTVAGAVAVLADPAGQAGVAARLVGEGLASAVLGTDAAGTPIFVTSGGPLWPWADCATGGPARTGRPAQVGGRERADGPQRVAGLEAAFLADGEVPIRAFAAQVELRDGSGTVSGTISAAQRVDADFVARLAAESGTTVSLLHADGPGGVVHGTEQTAEGHGDAVLAVVRDNSDTSATRLVAGRYVRRVGPDPGQPLPLVLSVPRNPPETTYAVLLGVVVLAGLLAALTAWRLARSTTRPLAELAQVAEQVARGDLSVRVPVRSSDEVGRLASTFNRMTREMECYAQALTTSRDQLRRHLAVLGDTLASTHDLQRILRVILRNACATTGAQAGVLFLLDPATGELVGQCAEGFGDAEGAPDRLRVPLGVGLLGTVAATGEPQRGRLDEAPEVGKTSEAGKASQAGKASERADDRAVPGVGEQRRRTYLAVPFSVPCTENFSPAGAAIPAEQAAPVAGEPVAPRPLGVLALYDRLGGDEFDDADLVTLRTFAGHAAVAVENVRIHEEAQRLSLTDPLTGLWNYRYLKESIRREVERANRFGRMLSVLALDLDRFKEVNDTYGHAAGDVVLVEFARRIRSVVREVDLIFRQGGEEFVVLLPETDARGAATVAERLGTAVRETPIPVRPPPGAAAVPAAVAVTVSVGIAVYPDHGSTGAEVLGAADDALYAAKAAGRDTYRVAAERVRPVLVEIPLSAAAASPADGMPWAGYRPRTGNGTGNGGGGGSGTGNGGGGNSGGGGNGGGGGHGGASFGPHPPRPARGR